MKIIQPATSKSFLANPKETAFQVGSLTVRAADLVVFPLCFHICLKETAGLQALSAPEIPAGDN